MLQLINFDDPDGRGGILYKSETTSVLILKLVLFLNITVLRLYTEMIEFGHDPTAGLLVEGNLMSGKHIVTSD
jgi:hypothetical protein